MTQDIFSLYAISPVDGRYFQKTKELGMYFSESALIYYRFIVELKYLMYLGENGIISITEDEQKLLQEILHEHKHEKQILLRVGLAVKDLEKTTNHDVKAVEYYLNQILDRKALGHLKRFVHIGLTSEDVTSNAHALSDAMFLNDVAIPIMKKLYGILDSGAKKYAAVPMMSMTHGQPATPTTCGKEVRIYAKQIADILTALRNVSAYGKCNGSSGNRNAHQTAFPHVNWQKFSTKFIEEFLPKGLILKRSYVRVKANSLTNQIEPHLGRVEMFQIFSRLMSIVRNISWDCWHYVSRFILTQAVVATETGSSTMPHKVNPINFENAIGNARLAQFTLQGLSSELPVSTMQRDLVDSTMQRAVGPAFGHVLIALKSLMTGLEKVYPNENQMLKELNDNPALLAEAIQTILRRTGEIEKPYEALRDFTRRESGSITHESLKTFIEELPISKETKEELLCLKVSDYVGDAEYHARFH